VPKLLQLLKHTKHPRTNKLSTREEVANFLITECVKLTGSTHRTSLEYLVLQKEYFLNMGGTSLDVVRLVESIVENCFEQQTEEDKESLRLRYKVSSYTTYFNRGLQQTCFIIPCQAL
jgi:hypothetical protein